METYAEDCAVPHLPLLLPQGSPDRMGAEMGPDPFLHGMGVFSSPGSADMITVQFQLDKFDKFFCPHKRSPYPI